MSVLVSRINTLQTKLSSQQLLILSRPADILYYTDFVCINPEEREAFLIVTTSTATLLYPSFSPIKKIRSITYHPGTWPSDLSKVVTELVQKEKIKEILLDKSSLFLNEFESLSAVQASFSELDRTIIWDQRIAKSASELLLLQKAASITAKVMQLITQKLTEGITEQEVSRWVSIEAQKLGAQTTSFPSVVAFGKHSALPHHQPTDTVLKKNTVVLIDIGAKYAGYCGDMTRTVWFGPSPDPEFNKIAQIVKTAYKQALAATKSGASGAKIDAAARSEIEKHGYGKQFIHTTGHGVGLEIHEQPSLYYKKEVELPQNAVITIEPGIYLEGKFGYRYENMVVVEKNEGKEITQ